MTFLQGMPSIPQNGIYHRVGTLTAVPYVILPTLVRTLPYSQYPKCPGPIGKCRLPKIFKPQALRTKVETKTIMSTVHLLDYVAGNVRSLANAVEKLGYNIQWVKHPEEIENAEVSRLRIHGVR